MVPAVQSEQSPIRKVVYLGNAIIFKVFSTLQERGYITFDAGLGTITKRTQTLRGDYRETLVHHEGHMGPDRIYFNEDFSKLLRDCSVDGIVTLAEKKSKES